VIAASGHPQQGEEGATCLSFFVIIIVCIQPSISSYCVWEVTHIIFVCYLRYGFYAIYETGQLNSPEFKFDPSGL
jgi:hypothetical protein